MAELIISEVSRGSEVESSVGRIVSRVADKPDVGSRPGSRSTQTAACNEARDRAIPCLAASACRARGQRGRGSACRCGDVDDGFAQGGERIHAE